MGANHPGEIARWPSRAAEVGRSTTPRRALRASPRAGVAHAKGELFAALGDPASP
jgi:hypothetical protein